MVQSFFYADHRISLIWSSSLLPAFRELYYEPGRQTSASGFYLFLRQEIEKSDSFETRSNIISGEQIVFYCVDSSQWYGPKLMNDFQVVLTIFGLVLFMNWISKKINFIHELGDGISRENASLLESISGRPDLEPMRPIYEGNCNTGNKNDFLYSIIYIIVMISAGCLIYWITTGLSKS